MRNCAKALPKRSTEALDFNRQDALAAAGDDYREEKVVVA